MKFTQRKGHLKPPGKFLPANKVTSKDHTLGLLSGFLFGAQVSRKFQGGNIDQPCLLSGITNMAPAGTSP